MLPGNLGATNTDVTTATHPVATTHNANQQPPVAQVPTLPPPPENLAPKAAPHQPPVVLPPPMVLLPPEQRQHIIDMTGQEAVHHNALSPGEDCMVTLFTESISRLMDRAPPVQPRHHNLDDAFPDQAVPFSGLEKTNMYSWCGLMPDEHLPPFWAAFNDTKSNGARHFVLNSFLACEQRINVHVQYTMRAEFLRDLKTRDFFHPHQVTFLNRGISPFSIQQLTEETAGEIHNEADAAEIATYVGVEDVLRRQTKGAAYIPTEPYMFLELVASFKALVHVLFGSASPLYLDAKEFYNIALEGQKYGHLSSIRLYQPDWFAHVLWQIYLYTQNYFDTSLRLDQLDQGGRLP